MSTCVTSQVTVTGRGGLREVTLLLSALDWKRPTLLMPTCHWPGLVTWPRSSAGEAGRYNLATCSDGGDGPGAHCVVSPAVAHVVGAQKEITGSPSPQSASLQPPAFKAALGPKEEGQDQGQRPDMFYAGKVCNRFKP